jgi:hypothetical protein
VLPIFTAGCATAGCHDAYAAGGYRLDSYEGIMNGLVPGNSQSSRLYQTMVSRDHDRMPPGHPLSKEERMLVRVWIDQGAEEVICFDPDPPIHEDTAWYNPLVCFQRDIFPLFQSTCATTGCHDAITKAEDFDFSSYEGILKGLVPGDPEESEIYDKIKKTDPEESEDRMPPPPNPPLAQAQIDSVYRWILLGAPDEDCGELCDTTDVTYLTHIESFIASYCLGCHRGPSPPGGVSLETYDQVVSQVNRGTIPAVVQRLPGYVPMPPSLILSDCNVSKFEIWIAEGLPE